MIEHDPLTPEQEQLLASLANGPIQITQREIDGGTWQRNHTFLTQIRAINMRIVRVAQNASDTVYEFSLA